MIHIDETASSYFRKLLQQQGVAGMAIRMRAVAPGTPRGDCKLEFCEAEEIGGDDYQIDMGGYSLVVDATSMPFLEDAEVSYTANPTGGELHIRAPRLKAHAPATGASLVERVQFVLDAEINPGVASHGGKVSLVEVRADGTVVLRMGGGCQGCGSADATLKHGIERTLKTRIPEVTAVVDATDHSQGDRPYYQRHQHGRSAIAG